MTVLRPVLSLVLALLLGAWSVQMRSPAHAPAGPPPAPCHGDPGDAPAPSRAHGLPRGATPDGPAAPEAPPHCAPGTACPLCVALAGPALLPLRAIGPAPLGPPQHVPVRDGRPAEPPTPPPQPA